MKLLLKFSYDGSKFYGFQRQKKERSVQKDIEEALSKIYNEDIVIKGAGRTDRGVHAINQYAHYDVKKDIKGLKSMLNKLLSDIKIKKVSIVSDDFHARYSPKKKIYIYKISYDETKDSNYYLILKKRLDVNLLKKTSKLFIGTHNFKNFVSGVRDNYETTIFNITFKERKNSLIITFEGIGFYRYMIRNLVGALIDVDKSKVTNKDIKDMLDNPDVEKQLSTAKSEGLYLKDIKY